MKKIKQNNRFFPQPLQNIYSTRKYNGWGKDLGKDLVNFFQNKMLIGFFPAYYIIHVYCRYIVDLYWSKGGEIVDNFFLNFMSCFFLAKNFERKKYRKFLHPFQNIYGILNWATLKKCRLKYFQHPLHTVNRTDKNIFQLGQRFHNKSRSALI